MSDCKVFRTEIDVAADGGALGRDAASHVESCAACGEELRGRAALRGLVRGLGRVEAPPDFEFRLRARMASSKPGGGRGLFAGSFPVGGLAWAAVAVCILSVTAAVYFRQAQPTSQGAQSRGEVASVPQAQASPTKTEPNNKIASNNTGEKVTPPTDSGNSFVAGGATPSGTQKIVAPKRAASQPLEKESVAHVSRLELTRGGSIDADLRPAGVILPQLNNVSSASSRVPAQGIQLGTSAGTLRVVLRDERGTLVPMRTVSFGSQEPLSRQTAISRLTPNDEEGVW
jgi:hypothetical protein